MSVCANLNVYNFIINCLQIIKNTNLITYIPSGVQIKLRINLDNHTWLIKHHKHVGFSWNPKTSRTQMDAIKA